jgi:hypothetical protein
MQKMQSMCESFKQLAVYLNLGWMGEAWLGGSKVAFENP